MKENTNKIIQSCTGLAKRDATVLNRGIPNTDTNAGEGKKIRLASCL